MSRVRCLSGKDFQAFTHLYKGLDGSVQMVEGVCCGKLYSDPGFAYWNYGEGESDHIDSLFEELIRHLHGQWFVIDHDRDDGSGTGDDVETHFLHASAEVIGIGDHVISEIGRFV